MSHSEKAPEVQDCEFKWGKKRGIGGKKKEVQFYESFTYDGDEYTLYDSVYLYKEGEPEPYIGKLVKIWEQPEHKRKVKVLWFFRPVEILHWLGDDVTLENEVFLASGEGAGLANVNPLEAIAGKCYVVCTSKDGRNPQPLEEELRMADYIFYRTFDVGKCTISDKLDEKIAGVEVRFLFNRNRIQEFGGITGLDANRREENGNVIASNEVSQQCLKMNSSEALKKNINRDDQPGHSVKKEDEDLKISLINLDRVPGGIHLSDLGIETKETEISSVKRKHVSAHEKSLSRPIADSCKDEGEADKICIRKVEDTEKLKSSNDLGVLDNKPLKKARLDGSVKFSEEPSISPSIAVNKGNNNILQKKLRADTNEDDMQASGAAGSAYEDKMKSKLIKDTLRQEKDSLKKVKPDEKTSKLSNGTLPKAATALAPEKNLVTDGQVLEVTRRPDTDRSKWFKGLPWEERMQAAHEQGTLVLLENLDPAYSSTEIEDIIWSGFRENCTAKVVPRTSVSSPHSGQAFVIFKSRDAAEMAIKNLDEGCLMLPNGRPLVASQGTPPSLLGKPSTFVGHLTIDKIKFQMQREEMRRAVSTSHCSQPNTVEYDMAMEWCLLQTRSDSWWKDLYKQHGDELKKLRGTLKSK